MVPQAEPPAREGLSKLLYIISISDLDFFQPFSIDFVLPTPPYSFTDPLSLFYRPPIPALCIRVSPEDVFRPAETFCFLIRVDIPIFLKGP
jgi:hypothetical protein